MSLLLFLLAWITAIASFVLFAIVAGPMSPRPFVERLLVWFVAMGMLGASLFRLFGWDDGNVTLVAYCIMLCARFGVACVGTWILAGWVWHKTTIRTPAEWVADQIVGYRR